MKNVRQVSCFHESYSQPTNPAPEVRSCLRARVKRATYDAINAHHIHACHWLYELQNKTHRRFSPGSIDVYLGKPIPTAGLTDDQIGELAEYCQAMHQSWLDTGEMPQLEGYPEPPAAKLAA